MTRQKDLKRLVRARMEKTGEGYAAARAQLVKKGVGPQRPAVSEYADLAGVRDETVRVKTGRDWKAWVAALDTIEAAALSHKDIARHVHATYDVSPWWAQTVTVGYERIRGLRDKRQRRDGAYEANKSKTFPVPVATLYRAFATARGRAPWLDGAKPTVRTSTANKSVRLTWEDGTAVQAWFVDKGPAKSAVQIQHTRLASQADVDARKAYWAERLGALAARLKAAG